MTHFSFRSARVLRRAGLGLAGVVTLLAVAACDVIEPGTTPTGETTVTPTATQPAGVTTPPANGSTPAPVDASPGAVANNHAVIEQIAPSVVHIRSTATRPGFFEPQPVEGAGTGVILSEDGYIGTNNHVVEGAQEITVTLFNRDTYQAEIVGRDPQTDLAVIKIEATGLQPATFVDPEQIQVGQPVLAVGHALDLPGGPTVTSGIISAVDRSIREPGGALLEDLLQTDAAINPGNSGGPLVNMQAEVAGVNTAIIQGSEGIGFAISSGTAQAVFQELIQQGFVSRGYMGIGAGTVDPAIAARLGLAVDYGVYVAGVQGGSPAAEAGLQEGDVIVAMNGERIESTGDLFNFLRDHLAGETVEVRFFRGGQEQTTQLTLGEQPNNG